MLQSVIGAAYSTCRGGAFLPHGQHHASNPYIYHSSSMHGSMVELLNNP
jgi:hypothetical protein